MNSEEAVDDRIDAAVDRQQQVGAHSKILQGSFEIDSRKYIKCDQQVVHVERSPTEQVGQNHQQKHSK